MGWKFFDKNGNEKQSSAAITNPAVGLSAPTTGIPNTGALTAVSSWTTEDFKTISSMHSSGGQLVAPYSGRYLVTLDWTWPATPSGSQLAVRKNGTTYVYKSIVIGSTTDCGTWSRIVNLSAGDYLEPMVSQSSATNPLVPTSGTFSMEYLDGAVSQPTAYPASLVGQEVAYMADTSSHSITATASPGTTVVTAPAFTADGVSSYLVEVFYPDVEPDFAAAGRRVLFALFEGATNIGALGFCYSASTTNAPMTLTGKVRITPSAGAHTYSVNCWVNAGTALVAGGTGGVNSVAGYIRVTKAT